MTIALPFDPSIGDGYDSVPGNNNDPPPKGSPEGQATSTHNDSARDTKAGVNQNAQNIGAINDALGTMAEQNSTAVSITGGSIGSGVSVSLANDSAQLGGVTLQQLFDLIYPVNDAVVHRHDESPPPSWPGISATWTLIADGQYLKAIQSGQTVGEVFGSSTTDSTVLTDAQLPVHRHTMFSNETITATDLPSSSNPVARDLQLPGGSDSDYRLSTGTLAPTVGATGNVGSGNGHDHTFAPPTYRIAVYRRTA